MDVVALGGSGLVGEFTLIIGMIIHGALQLIVIQLQIGFNNGKLTSNNN